MTLFASRSLGLAAALFITLISLQQVVTVPASPPAILSHTLA